jgi:hypothetical protein
VKSLLRHRPTPALVIALLALFISLGGVSYGVATGFIDSREIKNNEIRSLDIRDNQIRSRDIRNNEVRGKDIRNSTVQSRDIAINAVRGEDVKEDTLAKVPSALLADSATSADSVSTLKIIPVTTVATGSQPAVLASQGPLTLFGECSGTTATVSVSTTENDSAAFGTSTPEDLDTSDGRAAISNVDGAMNGRAYDATTVSVLAPSGKGFTGEVGLYINTATGLCRFHGSLALQG